MFLKQGKYWGTLLFIPYFSALDQLEAAFLGKAAPWTKLEPIGLSQNQIKERGREEESLQTILLQG